MTTIDIQDAVSSSGGRLVSATDPTQMTPYNTSETFHSVARVYNATTSFPTWVYTDKFICSYINVNKRNSTCSVEIHDSTLNEISDYNDNYGINIDTNLTGYDYLLVLAEETEAGIPTSGNFANDKVVLFSGYNRSTYSVDLDNKKVFCDYVGIEEMINEIKADGLLEVNHAGILSKVLSGDINGKQIKYYNRDVIFNEGGRKDCFIGQYKYNDVLRDPSGTTLATLQKTVKVFDKTGLQSTEFWTLADIFDYLVGLYLQLNFDLRSKLDQEDRLDAVSSFLRIDDASIQNSDLADVIPIDFNITGMGILDAIYKVLDESRRYSITKNYESDGVAIIGLRANSKAQRALDNSRDIPLKLPIGEAGVSAVKANIVNSTNLNLNRENKNYGRVVVRGSNLHINTLVTSWGNFAVNPNASNSKTAFSQAANSSLFSGHCNLLAIDYTESTKGVPEQTYAMMNTNMVEDKLFANLGMTLADFNELYEQDVFQNEKILEVNPIIALPFGNSGIRKENDMSVYVSVPFEKTDGKFSPSTTASGTDFLYIQPIEGSEGDPWKIRLKHKTNGFAMFTLTSSANKKDPGRTEHKFKEYIDNSLVVTHTKQPANMGTVTNEIPLYIRCSVKTDYKVRGIAHLAGYDSAEHQTLYIDDNDNETISLQYNDKTYDGSGGWNNLADGWLSDGVKEKAYLAKLQTKAEAILDKFSNMANSGTCELNYVQGSISIGDMIDEFEGTSRNFEYEAVINSVGYDLLNNKTIISFGADFE